MTLISGGDRSVRYGLVSPEIQADAQFGFYISVPGDVDGDSKDDVVVGAPYQEVYTGTGPACGAPEPKIGSVEEVLNRHPAVAVSAVVSAPGALGSEEVKAFSPAPPRGPLRSQSSPRGAGAFSRTSRSRRAWSSGTTSRARPPTRS